MKMFLKRTLLATLTVWVGILVSSMMITTPARAGVPCCYISCVGEDLGHCHGTTFLVNGQYIFCDYTNLTQMTGLLSNIKAAGIKVVIVDMTNDSQWQDGHLWPKSQIQIANIASACSSLGMQYAFLIGGDAAGGSVPILDRRAATILSLWASSPTYRTFGFNGDNRPLLVVFYSYGGAGLTAKLKAAPASEQTHLSQFHVVSTHVNLRQQYTSIDGWGYHGCTQSADGTVRYVSTQSSMDPNEISGTTNSPDISTYEQDWKKIPVSAWTNRVEWCSMAQCYSIYGTYDDTCDECNWGIANTSKAPRIYQYPGHDPYAYYNVVLRVLTKGLPAGTPPVDNQWLVQSESLGKSANVSSMQLKYKYAQSAGNLNLVVVQGSKTSATIKSVSDSDGNAYQLAIGPTTSAGSQQWMYYAPIIKASNSNGSGANTVSVTFSGQVSNADMTIFELTGVYALANAVSGSGNGITASTGYIANKVPEILVAGACSDGTCKTYLDPGYQRGGDGDFGDDVNGNEYQYVITPGSYNATMGVGGSNNTKCNWVMQLAAFYGPICAIDCGGGAAGDFSADSSFSGGTAYSTTSAIHTSKATNPAPQAVYQTERYGATSYTFGGLVAGQSYSVRLHFAEIFWTGPKERQFNVSINGTQVLTNFDIFATAGAANTAIVKTFGAIADRCGNIVIGFTNGACDQPKISGIEILYGGSPNGVVVVPVPEITSALTSFGGNGSPFGYQIIASGNPTSYAASGLPAGLSVNSSTGAIRGTPTTAATSNVTIKATNVTGTGSATLVLTVP